MTYRTADGINHGEGHIEDCLEAVVTKFDDGYILCPILICGGKCEDCMGVLERREQ